MRLFFDWRYQEFSLAGGGCPQWAPGRSPGGDLGICHIFSPQNREVFRKQSGRMVTLLPPPYRLSKLTCTSCRSVVKRQLLETFSISPFPPRLHFFCPRSQYARSPPVSSRFSPHPTIFRPQQIRNNLVGLQCQTLHKLILFFTKHPEPVNMKYC